MILDLEPDSDVQWRMFNGPAAHPDKRRRKVGTDRRTMRPGWVGVLDVLLRAGTREIQLMWVIDLLYLKSSRFTARRR
jgi:hypothetical protein